MRADRGFTVIEIIVVIVIVLVLAAILVPVIFLARMKGREAQCKNNMKQIHLGLQMFRDDNVSQGKELNPHWLNNLIWDPPQWDQSDPDPSKRAKPLLQPKLLVCPLDGSKGKQGGKPDGPGIPQYDELDEYKYFMTEVTPPRDRRSSYMYEFNMARGCINWDWKSYVTLPSTVTDPDTFVDLDGAGAPSKWGEAKTAQMRYGDTYLNADEAGNPLPESMWRGYSPSRFPVLRCFWHTDKPNTSKPKILNLSYEGQVFLSGALWEKESLQ